MAMLSNLSKMFGDVKTRTIFIFVIVLLVIAVGVGLTGLQRDIVPTGSSTTTTVPADIQNVPGAGTATPQYQALQRQRNVQAVETAKRTGTSAIPTLTGGFSKIEPTQPPPTTTVAVNPVEQQRVEKAAAQEAAKTVQQQQAQNQQLQDGYNKDIAKQAQALIGNWLSTSQQTLTTVHDTSRDAEANRGQGAGTGAQNQSGGVGQSDIPGGQEKPILVQAGTITFGVLTTAVNSNDDATVVATIVQGNLKGARLIGSYKPTKDKQRLVITFDLMNMPSKARSFPVKAVALNPKTGRPGIASDVNNHYLLRYGSLFASSFVQGYGQAVAQGGSISTTTPFGGTQTVNSKLSNTDELLSALQKVGDAWSQQVQPIFNTDPTVTINEGVGLGIMFLADITDY